MQNRFTGQEQQLADEILSGQLSQHDDNRPKEIPFPVVPVWEFQEGLDTKRSFEGFTIYRELPLKQRNYGEVAKRLELGVPAVTAQARGKNWEGRAQAYDAHKEALLQAQQVKPRNVIDMSRYGAVAEDYKRRATQYRLNTEAIGTGLTMMSIKMLRIYQHALAPVEAKMEAGESLTGTDIQMAMELATPMCSVGKIAKDGADLTGAALHIQKLMASLEAQHDTDRIIQTKLR